MAVAWENVLGNRDLCPHAESTLMKKPWGKGLACILRALRRFPVFVAFDDSRYDKLESLLMQHRPTLPSAWISNRFLIPSIIQQSIAMRSSYRLIDLERSDEDEWHFLSRQGMSVDFIKHNKPRGQSAKHLRSLQPNEAAPLPLDFQADAFSAGGIAAICPFSGRLVRSNRSILVAEGSPIYYRFETREVFYLAVGTPGIGYGKLYMYVPKFQTIILLRDICFWLGRSDVDSLRAHMISHWRDLIPYLQTQQAPLVCALIDNTHFAHHLWNDLSGVDKSLAGGYARYIDKVIVAAEPLGPVDRIFAALGPMNIERHQFPALLRQSLSKNWLLIRPGDNHISERLIKGVCDAAVAICPADVKNEAQRLRESCWPILWMTIRTGNRTWASQCSGIADIINDLSEIFPRMALIIDGFCIPYNQSKTDRKKQGQLIQKEMACIDSIRKRLGTTIPLHVNVGKPLHESVVFAMITDFYLAHHGSLQHKIGWIANCPGVVHSNADDLRGTSGKHRAMRARQNPVLPRYLDPTAIQNVPGAVPKSDRGWAEHFSNYDFDYRVARDMLLSLLKQYRS